LTTDDTPTWDGFAENALLSGAGYL
jgi:hypothetical protein